MTTAAVTPLITITAITTVLKIFMFGLIHPVEVLVELMAFCATTVETIVVVLVFGLIHPLGVLDELVAFCATAVERIVVVLVFGLIHILGVLAELVAFCATATETIVIIAVVLVCVIANVGWITVVEDLIELVREIVICDTKEKTDFR